MSAAGGSFVEYPVRLILPRPGAVELQQAMTVLERICSDVDGYALSVRSLRVFRTVGTEEMKPVPAWEARAVHRLGNAGLVFVFSRRLLLRSGAVRAWVNLLFATPTGFEVMEFWRDLKRLAGREAGDG
ncbi:hypothetical protein ACFV4N_03010 [Actinosynnema sp. NPDC059797]